MRRGRRYLDPKQILFYKSCFVFMMLLITVILVDSRIRPVIKTMSSYQAQVYATQVINDAVLEELTREGVTYGDLVTLTRNEKLARPCVIQGRAFCISPQKPPKK